MPTYDYVCDACGHAMEAFQSIAEARLKKCPKCKKSKLRRLIGSGAGIIFKGSGFYETDYKRARGGSSKSAGDSAPNESRINEPKSGTKSEPKNEPKSDRKSEPKPTPKGPKGDA